MSQEKDGDMPRQSGTSAMTERAWTLEEVANGPFSAEGVEGEARAKASRDSEGE
jgi:hypothetical protein